MVPKRCVFAPGLTIMERLGPVFLGGLALMQRAAIGLLALILPLSALARPAPAATTVPDPCTGRSGLLAEIDRPTIADSPCSVRPGRQIIEFGYAHVRTGDGTSENGPQLELRFGLPDGNELVLLPPNITHGTNSGTVYGGTTVGFKHEWGYSRHWIGASEALVTTPRAKGPPGTPDGGWGEAVNGIVGYSVSRHFGLGFMLGVSSLTGANNRRYESLNPDLTATWLLDPRCQLYAELYGQSQTGYGLGAGFDADGGIQYLLTRHFEVDAELGQQVSGLLGQHRDYWGVGGGWEF